VKRIGYAYAMSTTAGSNTAIIEAPSRAELLVSFAKRFQYLSARQIERRFNKYEKLGLIDARRDELSGEWHCLLRFER
jgi:hypothetical protein